MKYRGPSPSVEEFERLYVKPCPGKTLVAGSRVYEGREDRRLRYADAVGWDIVEGEGVDQVMDLDEWVLPTSHRSFSHIDCISVLEHTLRPWMVAENLVDLLKIGGTLYVAVPFIWRVHNYPSDYWRFSIDGIRRLFGDEIIWIKIVYAHEALTDEKKKLPAFKVAGYPYYARTEVCGFGVKQ